MAGASAAVAYYLAEGERNTCVFVLFATVLPPPRPFWFPSCYTWQPLAMAAAFALCVMSVMTGEHAHTSLFVRAAMGSLAERGHHHCAGYLDVSARAWQLRRRMPSAVGQRRVLHFSKVCLHVAAEGTCPPSAHSAGRC